MVDESYIDTCSPVSRPVMLLKETHEAYFGREIVTLAVLRNLAQRTPKGRRGSLGLDSFSVNYINTSNNITVTRATVIMRISCWLWHNIRAQ
jgi:hypothetical protein